MHVKKAAICNCSKLGSISISDIEPPMYNRLTDTIGKA